MILKYNNSLIKVSISGCDLGASQNHARALADMLSSLNPSCPITHLNLSKNLLGARTSEEIANCLTSNLTHIDLRDNLINMDDGQKLTDKVQRTSERNLVSLDLRQNKCDTRTLNKLNRKTAENKT